MKLQPPALAVRVLGIGLLGPGLPDWASGSAFLRQPETWQLQPTVVPPPLRLPATERRRAGTVVKASVVVADQAVAAGAANVATWAASTASAASSASTASAASAVSDPVFAAPAATIDPAQLATVFTSSTGDPTNCHLLCEALAARERLMSPTRFTNSVHNAAAGYWHIATHAGAASTSLAAFDASFSAGLLEAAVQCQQSGQPVLLVACDVPYPEPLHAVRPVLDVFAVALLLAPAGEPGATGAAGAGSVPSCNTAGGARTLLLRPAGDTSASSCGHPGWDRLCQGIPAARALPLLQALAQPQARCVVVAGLEGQALAVDVSAEAPDPTAATQDLDAAGIAARIPHSGSMCLLHSLQQWSADTIHCTATSHLDGVNPLRSTSGLLSVNAIEYASQAMALHGSLNAAPGTPPAPGFLASVRNVRLNVDRLDTIDGKLHVHAHKLAGDTRQALYRFNINDDQDRVLVDGRATVVLTGVPQLPGSSVPRHAPTPNRSAGT